MLTPLSVNELYKKGKKIKQNLGEEDQEEEISYNNTSLVYCDKQIYLDYK